MNKIDDREEIKKERDSIKTSNYQFLLSVLKNHGIDGTKIPRFEFDKLLRVVREDAVLQQAHNKLMLRFSEIVAPYKTVVSPDISDEISHAPLEPESKEEIPAEAQEESHAVPKL